jgi:hypothetical protein
MASTRWRINNRKILLGANKVFWGVTESRHLVDIINQTDLVEDIDEEQNLGQPMVNLLLQRDWGQLDFYLKPWFREPVLELAEAGDRLLPFYHQISQLGLDVQYTRDAWLWTGAKRVSRS